VKNCLNLACLLLFFRLTDFWDILYYSDNEMKENAVGMTCSAQDETSNVYRIVTVSLMVQTARKTWYNINMNLKEMETFRVDWFHVAQNMDYRRDFVNTVMNLPVS
jgi:hypothetical protein